MLQSVAAHHNTSPQFLPPEMEDEQINLILAYEIAQLFDLYRDLSLFSTIQSTL